MTALSSILPCLAAAGDASSQASALVGWLVLALEAALLLGAIVLPLVFPGVYGLVFKQMRQRALGSWLTLLSVLLGMALVFGEETKWGSAILNLLLTLAFAGMQGYFLYLTGRDLGVLHLLKAKLSGG